MKRQALEELEKYKQQQTLQAMLKEILALLFRMNENINKIETVLEQHAKDTRGGF